MFQKLGCFFVGLILMVFAAHPALAENLEQDDLAFAFGDTVAAGDLGEMALLSEREMMETEGEAAWFWPMAYGVMWGLARTSIWTGGRFGGRWGFTTRTSTNNHRILLRNNNHFLQTGGWRGVGGMSQRASHIGWGRSPYGNFSHRHFYYNRPWSIR